MPLRMKKQRLGDAIYAVRFQSQYAAASTFLRIQEHYESSRFRNQVFTLEQYMDWYAAEYGAFTYFEDWEGFNVPSTAFTAFREGRFDPLLEKEERLLRMFATVREPFYVIGLYTDTTLKHEIAHALFFTEPEYRAQVRDALSAHDTSALSRRLASMGYHRAVLDDEVHAYLVSGDDTLGVQARGLTALRRHLRSLYREYAKGIVLAK
jgi:hypothetical protein